MFDVLLMVAGIALACAYALRQSRRARIQRLDARATALVTVDGRQVGLHRALWTLAGHGGADEVGRVLLTSTAHDADELWSEVVAAVEAREPATVQASERHAALERQAAVERATWRAHTRLVLSASAAGVVERAVVALDAEPEWVARALADLDPAIDAADSRALLAHVEQVLATQISSAPDLAGDGAARGPVVSRERALAAAARLDDSVPVEDWAGITYPMRDVLVGFGAERARLVPRLREIERPRYRRTLGETALFLLGAVADADVTRRHLELEAWDAEVVGLCRTASPAERGAVLASRADLCRRMVVDYELLDEVLDAYAHVADQQAGVQPAA